MPHRVCIVTAEFYPEIAARMCEGAEAVLAAAGCTSETMTVPGALEIPQAIRLCLDTERYDGYVALGCVIRGETSHYEIVCQESARGLMDLSLRYGIPVGNGILTVDTRAQARHRASPAHGNKGAAAAQAVLALLEIRDTITQ